MHMSKAIEEAVRSRYGSVATSGLSSDQAGVRAVAEAFGYRPEELASIPAAANMGLSCGNPTATAGLRPGEVVVDLGPSGRAIGIDMTPEMIALARKNAAQAFGSDRQPLGNVEFHQASIDRMPLADAPAYCVISNCVLNLVPDKPSALREIARVLKPGGRLAVIDIALKRPLPPEIGGDLLAYVGCITGAILIDDYRKALLDAGFAHVEIIDSGADLNAYARLENRASCCSPATDPIAVVGEASSCCGTPEAANTPELLAGLADLLRRYDVNDYAASVKVYAVKPA